MVLLSFRRRLCTCVPRHPQSLQLRRQGLPRGNEGSQAPSLEIRTQAETVSQANQSCPVLLGDGQRREEASVTRRFGTTSWTQRPNPADWIFFSKKQSTRLRPPFCSLFPPLFSSNACKDAGCDSRREDIVAIRGRHVSETVLYETRPKGPIKLQLRA